MTKDKEAWLFPSRMKPGYPTHDFRISLDKAAAAAGIEQQSPLTYYGTPLPRT